MSKCKNVINEWNKVAMRQVLTVDDVIKHCGKRVRDCEMVHDTDSNVYQEHKLVAECLQKLKRYEDLEKQGKLVELPCAYGDTVYVIDYDENIVEMTINEIRRHCNGWFFIPNKCRPGFRPWEFGNIVFLTKEEAEVALQERKMKVAFAKEIGCDPAEIARIIK